MEKETLPLLKSGKTGINAAVTGAIAGLINGLFGGGGGMVVVPALSYLAGYKTKQAHATAILIILPLSITSGMLYLSITPSVLSGYLPVIIGATAGGAVGGIFLKKLSAPAVTLVFSLLMAAAGIRMTFF